MDGMKFVFALVTVFCFSLLPSSGRAADGLGYNLAVKSTTILEIYIGRDRIRAEVEIGVGGRSPFRDILPEETRAELETTGPSDDSDVSGRHERFFREGLIIRLDGGEPLEGKVLRSVSRPRTLRDPMTGAPLPPRGDGR